jgi:hypothetical protein
MIASQGLLRQTVDARIYPEVQTMAKKKAAPKAGPKKAAKRKTAKRKAAKRELIDTGRDKRFVRRGKGGKFKESDDVGRSLSQDRKRKAKRVAKSGQGDKGDRKR